jgi:hypothetical protein
MSATRICGTTDKPPLAPKNCKKTHHSLGGMPVRFKAIDGEGFTDEDGVHRYKLLGVGQEQISNNRGLDWDETLDFLYSHYEKGTAFVGFFLGYDFTQWFKNLSEERARMLLTVEGRAKRQRKVKSKTPIAPHPVEYHGWQFDILGSKRLRIRPKRCGCAIQSCPCTNKAPWMYVCDVGGFFQTSFLNVIAPRNWPDPIVTEEEYAILERGKASRSNAVLDADNAEYNRLENAILERVMYKYAEGLEAAGIHLTPSKWFGPGQAAQEWLRGRAPKREEVEAIVPLWFRDAARMSYIGGWFELFIHGMIIGDAEEYDLNSAYSAIIASLPCLLHGTYTRGEGKPPETESSQLVLVRARAWGQAYGDRGAKKHYIGAMLHRDPYGRISRPLVTEGWYWQHELDAAYRAKCITKITEDRYFEWVMFTPGQCPPDCHPQPLRELRSLYRQRLAVGKDSPLGKAAKTIYNSNYGKFAQSVGNPLFGNPIYASLITAGCRTLILDAIATHPGGKANVLMVATDAVFFLDKHPGLKLSQNLGEWSHKHRTNLTVFKPGVYWDDSTREAIAKGEHPTFKARGINAVAFASELASIDRSFTEWNGRVPSPWTDEKDTRVAGGKPQWPVVHYRPNFVMVTALQALIQKDWSKAGLVTQGDDVEPVEQSSVPYDKRCDVYFDESRGVYRSEPLFFGETCGPKIMKVGDEWVNVIMCASTPYEKRFGADDPFSDESKERWGITPDGYVSDPFRDILMGRVGPQQDVSPGHSVADVL